MRSKQLKLRESWVCFFKLFSGKVSTLHPLTDSMNENMNTEVPRVLLEEEK